MKRKGRRGGEGRGWEKRGWQERERATKTTDSR